MLPRYIGFFFARLKGMFWFAHIVPHLSKCWLYHCPVFICTNFIQKITLFMMIILLNVITKDIENSDFITFRKIRTDGEKILFHSLDLIPNWNIFNECQLLQWKKKTRSQNLRLGKKIENNKLFCQGFGPKLVSPTSSWQNEERENFWKLSLVTVSSF